MQKKLIWIFVFFLLAATSFGGLFHYLQKGGVPEQIVLAEGTTMETSLLVLNGESDGPCLFIIAGIHGDEIAGWQAANQLAQILHPKTGAVYILSTANTYGAAEDVRRTADNRDLNRIFPGNPDGDATQRLAREIFDIVGDIRPVLVLDLHEALPKRENRDYLGNSIIFSSMDGIEDLVFSILEETAAGNLCSQPFDYFSSAPAGSFNQVISEELGIPVITVETYREDPLDVRIQNHIDLALFVMEFYGIA